MPSPQQILDGLTTISNDWRTLAVIWHVVALVFVGAIAAGWRPSKPTAGFALASPFASVSAMAWAGANPFNGIVFAGLAAGLAAVALRLPRQALSIGAAWQLALGIPLLAFGWAYPHFLRAEGWAAYLYAAPMGLIPCPTLSAVTGMTLILGSLGSRTWSFVLAGASILYGLVGVFRLGVTIDVVLLAGAAALVADRSSGAPFPRGSR